MSGDKLRLVFFFLFCQLLLTSKCFGNTCFKAGVLEHVRITPLILPDVDHLELLHRNLDIYTAAVKTAKENKVELLVFPEDGLYVAWSGRRTETRLYAEFIPVTGNVSTAITPCSDPRYTRAHSPGALQRLSCMAKDAKLYLVVDVSEVDNCTATTKKCPDDGYLLYNTAVVFDPEGRMIAKYRKAHLFGEFQYNVPQQEYGIFDTPWGKVGVMICWDLMYKSPGVKMAEEMGVKTVILSTWWFDEMPLLVGPSFNQGWAHTHGVNLLVSNMNHVKSGSTGSGIYAGTKGAVNYYHDSEGRGQPMLIVADLNRDPEDEVRICFPLGKKFPIEFPYNSPSEQYAVTEYSLENFKHVKVTSSFTEVCNGTFCCSLSIPSPGGILSNRYIFGISNNIRAGFQKTGYEWCQESCIFAAVNDPSNSSSSYAKGSSEIFYDVTIRGNFKSPYAYPVVMSSDYKLSPKNTWKVRREGHTKFSLQINTGFPILMAGFHGRCYHEDPPYDINNFWPKNNAPHPIMKLGKKV